MADNSLQNGTDNIATDELTTINGAAASVGLKVQRFKVGHGVDGDYKDATAADPLPITGAVTGAFFPATQPVSGTVAVSNMVAQGLTDTQLRLTPVPVSGTVTTGGLTDAQLRLTAVPVSGAFFQATQPVSLASTTITGSVAVTGGLTDTQLRATAVPVSGSFFQATQPVSLATLAVTNAGTFAVQAASTLAAETTKVIGTVNVAAGQSVAVSSNGVVSTVNSSAVALGISGVFTGTSEDVTEYVDIRVSVFADQASATDGLQMQQSSNGTNWDIADSYNIPASTGKIFSVGVSAKFFRIVYTNVATAQTVFRLQVKYHKAYSKGSSVRPQDARANDNDYEEQLSHLMGFNGTTWDRVRSTIANGVLTDVSRIVAALPTGANVIGGVTGAFFQATQPVSAVSLPLPAGAATETTLAALNTKVTAVNTGAVVLAAGAATIGAVNIAAAQTLATVTTVSAVTAITNALPTGANTIGAVTGPAAAPLSLDATQTNHTQRLQAVTTLTTLSVANTAVTLTLPAVAAQFHYITRIEIVRVATAAVTGTAVLGYTSSNIPGAWARSAGNAIAAGGTVKDVDEVLVNSIKSAVVNTATTIVAPAAGAAVQVRITAYYYTAA